MRRPLIRALSLLALLCLLASCSPLDPDASRTGTARAAEEQGSAGSETAATGSSATRPKWKKRLDKTIPRKGMSVHVRYGGRPLYSRDARNMRPPASNEKLLLTMALFDALGPRHRISTYAAADRVEKGVVRGDLWIKGRGDPSLSKGGAHARALRFATKVNAIVRKLKRRGIRRITGDVMGSKWFFARDWDAPGWKSYFNNIHVALPTALAMNGNVHKGRHTSRPELVLAKVLRKRLRKAGIWVAGSAGMGTPPKSVKSVVAVESAPLGILVRYMNRVSSNFFAETLGKLLAATVKGPPGTIAGGARRLKAWARLAGVRVKAFDSSGLSYDNRMSARGIVSLLEAAKERPWATTLRRGLARGGQGTLKKRLHKVRIRAKTGTLEGVSTLSGWVWLRRGAGWAEFSIMSRGFSKSRAVDIEDRVVRILTRRAR